MTENGRQTAGSYLKSSPIDPSDFLSWTNQHMYRTSSSDMSSKVPVSSKNYAIPGYLGYIPGASDSPMEKSFSRMSKDQLNRAVYLPARTTDSFPNKPVNFSRTSGKFGGGLEDEYHTVSRFHGKCTIPVTHPNYQDNLWLTSSKISYGNQEDLRSTIYRKTGYSPTKSRKVGKRSLTAASGFVQNSTLFDGHGWMPIGKLHGDMKVSEYRNRYNPYVPFHPRRIKSNLRAMKKRRIVY